MPQDHSHIETFDSGLTFVVDDRGEGRPILLLHGGGGPASVAAFANTLAQEARVLAPTHPGFAETARPEWFGTVENIASAYLALLDRHGLRDVLVVGSSMGGWIAAEMAAQDSSRLAGLVLVDAVGIEVPGETILDVFSVPRSELSSYSYHNADAFRMDPTKFTPEQAALTASNFAALAVYSGAGKMSDPALRGRLKAVQKPVLVVWGESDRVVTPAYGRAFAAAFPNGQFDLIRECGHLPQIEQPARLLATIDAFRGRL
ncbi:alpha/beta fold hydrolase [Methylocapsa sp. S129]|uniref:alpha/beta fold hydrolase n=1 Tax=Methylocapsa sp. S129 TaxID=1641869 RepID=UPI00131B515A|nr:alpha/beta hydrolase [Methylocapsa sp. S129]